MAIASSSLLLTAVGFPTTTFSTAAASSAASSSVIFSAASSSSTTRASLGPLTSIFNPPDACSYYGGAGNSADLNGFWAAQGCSDSTMIDTDTCWPPITSTLPQPSPPLEGFGFYSPGLVCPNGYYTACVSSYATEESAAASTIFASEYEFQFELEPGETAVGCCPTGLVCTNLDGGAQTCMQEIQSTSFSIAFCGSSSYSTVSLVTLPGEVTYQDEDSNTFSLPLSSVPLYGPLIQMNFKVSDLSLTSSISDLNTNTQTPQPPMTQPTTRATIDTPSATETPARQDTGLSISSKIAVGVAVPLGVIALALAGVFALFRYRRRRAPMAVPPEQQPLDAQKMGAYHDAGISVGTEVTR